MAASLAFSSQTDLVKSWEIFPGKTFFEFYLKDMTQVHDDLHTLGPLVAAQKVVVP